MDLNDFKENPYDDDIDDIDDDYEDEKTRRDIEALLDFLVTRVGTPGKMMALMAMTIQEIMAHSHMPVEWFTDTFVKTYEIRKAQGTN